MQLLALWWAPCLVFAAAAFVLGDGAAGEGPSSEELLAGVPADFPRFELAGHDREAALLTHYYWYHFHTRLGNNRCLFNKEYLTIGDLWAAGAVDPQRGAIQEVHRADLAGIRLSDDGYVHTHQHWSHAHDYGWPFPFWTQVPGGFEGWTAGWLFQEDGTGWAWDSLRGWADCPYTGSRATQGWGLERLESLGIEEKGWRLRATGESPALVTPEGVSLDASNAPFLQVRWRRAAPAKTHLLAYVEWQREEDGDFGPDRRVYFAYEAGLSDHEAITGMVHSIVEMYRHPKWQGKVKRLRLCLAPGEAEADLTVNAVFTCYDTRHTINNPIFILACWSYFRWTGDLDFLRSQVNRMRAALRYQQVEMGGVELGHIRNRWVGHDGLPGLTVNADGTKTFHPGHGIGSNYWDILPFGWDDLYATNQYHAATLAMAELEEAMVANPGWGVPRGGEAFDPAELRRHAARVRQVAGRKFWDERKGRFVGCVDAEGVAHDYGFTFVNLDAIWYGLASDEQAGEIIRWLSGERIVDGDTSTGADIYRWRFGPRATTRRNVEWYCQGWTAPESLPWGAQVQDGGAVLGFSFYDLWARLKVRGPDDAWQRLSEMLAWEDEVWKEGGYREYYKDGKRGTTLQGGGTAGGIGIDAEFFESILVPSVVVYGFLGLEPRADCLALRPNLPSQCPEMSIRNLLYRGCRMDVTARDRRIKVTVHDRPREALRLVVEGEWRLSGSGWSGTTFEVSEPGTYVLKRG